MSTRPTQPRGEPPCRAAGGEDERVERRVTVVFDRLFTSLSPFRPRPDGSSAWHPFADVAATLPPWPRPAELCTADGQVLLRFPADARPLGFTPGGLSLLLLRSFPPPDRGVLELWSTAGEEEGA